MLRYLWLCAVLLAPKPPPLVMIDEPEVSLHPQLLLLLAGLLQEAATKCQVIVATQSAELINWLEPGEVVVLDQEDDEEGKRRTVARRGDAFDLDEWLGKYTLGEAWTTGMIGGRS
jgi:predicted ATPase